MEAVCKELDDVKAALEKLTAEHNIKIEHSESLKRAHNDQLVKIKEAKVVIEKQTEELNAKKEEISVMSEKYENLKSTLHEKDSALKHLSSANEKLRSDYGEKLQKFEVKNKELAFSLEEANIRAEDREKKIRAFKEENEGLKGLLSVSQKKCFEAEQRAQASKELQQRDNLLMKVEEENTKIEDQLKWKKEQFTHLEEAYKKVQDEFRTCKKAWEQEKSTLVDKICSLETHLDSQTKTLESLQQQLTMCNQALAHEESRRRLLEVQICESKTCYKNVCLEFDEVESKTESLTVRRDEEIVSLRDLLGTREKLFREMEFRNGHLEEENRELRKSLKELQEDQIRGGGDASTVKKLRNKLRGLEKVHKECSTNLKAREAEWNRRVEEMIEDLSECRSKLDCKDKQLQDMEMELERCQSSIMQLQVENEEMSLILMMFKSGVSDSQSKLLNSGVEMEPCSNKEAEEQIALLMEELEQKNNDLVKARAEIEQERERATLLMRKIKSLDLIEQKYILMQKELEESSGQQFRLKEQVLQTENSLKKDLRKVSDALNKANSELFEKTREGNELEFELYLWKSIAERLQSCLDEKQELHKEMEASLLAEVEIEESLTCEVEEKDKRVGDLHQTILLLEEEIVGKNIEINKLHEAWEKITTAVILGQFEIQEKNLVIVELEDEINTLRTEELETTLEAKLLEMMGIMDQLRNKLRTSEGLAEKLESEKRILLEGIRKLSLERGDLLADIGGLHGQLAEFLNEDDELMGRLGRIVQSFSREYECEGDDELYDSNRENVMTPISSLAKKVEANLDGRSPLKERNN